jgi:DNA ligase-1
MTELPMLYSRRSDGGTQNWQIEVYGPQYRTHSGIEGGAITASAWTTALPKNVGKKNEVSASKQAEKEAKAAHKKKLAEGYHDDIGEIDNAAYFSPMLAHVYEDYTKIVAEALAAGEKVFCQPKLDGMRCVAQKSGLTSRNGKPIISAPHVHDAVKRRFTGEMNWVTDGELYADKFAKDFNTIISLAKKSQPDLEDLMESAAKLEYHIYDLPVVADHRGPINAPFLNTFSERLVQMRFLFSAAPSPIKLVETVQVHSMAEIESLFSRWLAEGYEGLMIRIDRTYQVGKRSKFLLKYKLFTDAEFEIVDIIEGIGTRSGMAGSMKFKLDDTRTFESGIRGNFKIYTEMLKNKRDYIGKLATVTFQNLTPAGVPRFPIYLRMKVEE